MAEKAADAPDRLPAEETLENSIGMRFVRIESGTFQMGETAAPLPDELVEGCPQRENNEGAIHISSSQQFCGLFSRNERAVAGRVLTIPFFVGLARGNGGLLQWMSFSFLSQCSRSWQAP